MNKLPLEVKNLVYEYLDPNLVVCLLQAQLGKYPLELVFNTNYDLFINKIFETKPFKIPEPKLLFNAIAKADLYDLSCIYNYCETWSPNFFININKINKLNSCSGVLSPVNSVNFNSNYKALYYNNKIVDHYIEKYLIFVYTCKKFILRLFNNQKRFYVQINYDNNCTFAKSLDGLIIPVNRFIDHFERPNDKSILFQNLSHEKLKHIILKNLDFLNDKDSKISFVLATIGVYYADDNESSDILNRWYNNFKFSISKEIIDIENYVVLSKCNHYNNYMNKIFTPNTFKICNIVHKIKDLPIKNKIKKTVLTLFYVVAMKTDRKKVNFSLGLDQNINKYYIYLEKVQKLSANIISYNYDSVPQKMEIKINKRKNTILCLPNGNFIINENMPIKLLDELCERYNKLLSLYIKHSGISHIYKTLLVDNEIASTYISILISDLIKLLSDLTIENVQKAIKLRCENEKYFKMENNIMEYNLRIQDAQDLTQELDDYYQFLINNEINKYIDCDILKPCYQPKFNVLKVRYYQNEKSNSKKEILIGSAEKTISKDPYLWLYKMLYTRVYHKICSENDFYNAIIMFDSDAEYINSKKVKITRKYKYFLKYFVKNKLFMTQKTNYIVYNSDFKAFAKNLNYETTKYYVSSLRKYKTTTKNTTISIDFFDYIFPKEYNFNKSLMRLTQCMNSKFDYVYNCIFYGKFEDLLEMKVNPYNVSNSQKINNLFSKMRLTNSNNIINYLAKHEKQNSGIKRIIICTDILLKLNAVPSQLLIKHPWIRSFCDTYYKYKNLRYQYEKIFEPYLDEFYLMIKRCLRLIRPNNLAPCKVKKSLQEEKKIKNKKALNDEDFKTKTDVSDDDLPDNIISFMPKLEDNVVYDILTKLKIKPYVQTTNYMVKKIRKNEYIKSNNITKNRWSSFQYNRNNNIKTALEVHKYIANFDPPKLKCKPVVLPVAIKFNPKSYVKSQEVKKWSIMCKNVIKANHKVDISMRYNLLEINSDILNKLLNRTYIKMNHYNKFLYHKACDIVILYKKRLKKVQTLNMLDIKFKAICKEFDLTKNLVWMNAVQFMTEEKRNALNKKLVRVYEQPVFVEKRKFTIFKTKEGKSMHPDLVYRLSTKFKIKYKVINTLKDINPEIIYTLKGKDFRYKEIKEYWKSLGLEDRYSAS